MSRDPVLKLSSEKVREIAKKFGTPLYVVDESVFRQRIQRYQRALTDSWPNTKLAYASKANSNLTLVRIAYLEGCLIDAASEGEIEAALRAGVPPSAIQLHGSNKSSSELDRAIALGIRQIIVDSVHEIGMLAERAEHLRSSGTKLLLRTGPGVDPITHKKISTGQEDTKFGLNIADGSARLAVGLCLEAGLPLIGFHAHVGSQLLDPDAQIVAAERIADLAVEARDEMGLETLELNFGGGLGISYQQEQQPLPIQEYVFRVNDAAKKILKSADITATIVHEPGRALIGPAGVTLYQLGGAKPVFLEEGSRKVYLSVDGGLADNPRPALYDAFYEVEIATCDENRTLSHEDCVPVTICGRHCETDTLFEDVLIPRNSRSGDFAQVLATGAYNNSMASNYNRYPRPKLVLIRDDGSICIIQQSESWDQMFSLESIPEGI